LVSEREIIRVMAGYLYKEGWMANDISTYGWGDGLDIICSIDTFVASTDMPPGMGFRDAARKAATGVVSDFASKGARVEAILFSLSLPRTHTLKEIREIAEGLAEAGEEYGFQLLGGDTNEAKDFVITCCGLGRKRLPIVSRSGAMPGDVVATTGLYGLQPLGLHLLKIKATSRNGVEKDALESFLRPVARVEEGYMAISSGMVTSSIDSSDGLLQSLYEIAENSGVRIVVETIPIHPSLRGVAERYDLDPESLALEGGEEYELIFTVRREGWNLLESSFSKAGKPLHRIGRVEGGEGVYLEREAGAVRLERRGWEHFSKR
jgi:thiamine-monophosphate kinase